MIRFVDAPPPVKTEIVLPLERPQPVAIAEALDVGDGGPAVPPPGKRGRGRPRKEAKPS